MNPKVGIHGRYEEKLAEITVAGQKVSRENQPHAGINEIRQNQKNLFISEGAGAGKTILTRRLAKVISEQAAKPETVHPLMVFRFVKPLPKSGFIKLRELLLACSSLDKLKIYDSNLTCSQKEQFIDFAIENKRVVLILDGLDEFSDADKTAFFKLLSPGGDGDIDARNPATVTTIISGRHHAIDKHHELHNDTFRRISIRPFSKKLQDEYFDGKPGSPPDKVRNPLVGSKFAEKKWRDVLPEDNTLDELLGLPHTLNQIRVAIQGNVDDPEETELKRHISQSDLFLYASDGLLNYALNQRKINDPSILVGPKKILLEKVIGVVAFEMTINGHYGNVSAARGERTNEIKTIRQAASERFISLELGEKEEYNNAWDLLNKIEFNHRGYYEDWSDEYLSFRNWRTQELHVARFLTQHANQNDLETLKEKITDDNWLRILILAAQMPIKSSKRTLGADWNKYQECIKCIFSRPTGKTGRRPTEAMYKAITFLGIKRDEDRKKLITELRSGLAGEFQKILQGNPEWIIDNEETNRLKLIAEGIFHKKDDVGKEINPDKSLFVFLADPARPVDANDNGQFTMGSPQEKQFKVQLSPFAMHRFQVRNKEFQLFDAGQADLLQKEFNGPDQPAIDVSWYDAVVYTWFLEKQQVNGKDWEIGLPTEAQWEYACRAGSTTAFCFGDKESDLEKYAWFDGNPKTNDQTHPVGQLQHNAWGLYDMHGNAWEWCADWYAVELTGGNDPTGPAVGSIRVLRGGSWSYVAADCRSAFRHGRHPGIRNWDEGFRVALRPSGIPR